jgi:nitrogen fixation protein NifU and related proteins
VATTPPRPRDPAAAAYSPAFLDHLVHPRNQGALSDATHRGEAQDGVCGDRLSLDLRVEAGLVSSARFRVQGCPGAIAVGSALASLAPGRAARTDSVSAADLEAALGGVPPAKRHALRLAIDAWRAAIDGRLGV